MNRKFHVMSALAVLIFGLAVFACAGGGGDDDDGAGNDDDADDDTSGEEVWTDPDTGLGWQNGEAVGTGSFTAADAAAYCESLAWAGFDDWRLPTIGELRGLIRGCADTATGGSCQVRDDCTSWHCYTIMCDGCADGDGPGADGAYWPEELKGNRGGYWSITSIPDVAGSAWPADFDEARITHNDQVDRGARCVRGTGSGITDDTGEAYRVSLVFFVAGLESTGQPTPLQGLHCDLLDVDGEPLDETMSAKSDEYGWCVFAFNHPFDTFSVKATASGFNDIYAIHYPALRRDEQGNDWGWIIGVPTEDVTDAILGEVGLERDPAKGQVFGNVQWVPTIPSANNGASFVGCAEIEPWGPGFYYTDASGSPMDGLTMTSPAQSVFFGFNQDPGTMELTATVDGNSVSTGEFEVVPDSWTFLIPHFDEAQYPENPTPDSCL